MRQLSSRGRTALVRRQIGLEPITLKTPRVLRAAAPNQQFFARAGLTGLPGPRPRNMAIFEMVDDGLPRSTTGMAYIM